MSFALIIIVLAFLCMATGAGLVGFFAGRSRLPPPSDQPQDRRLAEQVELLQGELSRLQEQADFTERLLSERGGAPGEGAAGVDAGDE
jgi:hypothetical protein